MSQYHKAIFIQNSLALRCSARELVSWISISLSPITAFTHRRQGLNYQVLKYVLFIVLKRVRSDADE